MAPHQHRSLQRQPRQQAARTRRTSLYHAPPQLSSANNPVRGLLGIADEDSLTDNNNLPRERGYKPPLCVAKKKQLLHDIEDGGGLQVFSLSKIRLARPNFYDDPEYVLKQVQNYVYQLKNFDDTKYLLQLNHYGVLASSRLSHFFSPGSPASQPATTPQTPALPLPTDSQPTPAFFPELSTPIPESTFTSPVRNNRNSTTTPIPTFASPSRYNRTSHRLSEPAFISPAMNSPGFNSTALALRHGNYDEVEGM